MSSIHNATPMGAPLPDGDLPYDITRPSRRIITTEAKELRQRREAEAADRASKNAVGDSADRVEVSAEAEILLRRGEGRADVDEAHKQRIADLRERYLEGRLNTPELVDQAATAILGG